MGTIKLLLAFVCFAAIGRNQLRGHDHLTGRTVITTDDQKRSALVKIAEQELGIRELTDHNDGERVEAYLATVKLKKGEPWCAAFISWIYSHAGYSRPRSGWCPDFFPSSRLTNAALPANILGIYFQEKKRIAHVGLIVGRKGNFLISIEGNTNMNGSREGSGVYKRIRHIRTIQSIADWVAERRTGK